MHSHLRSEALKWFWQDVLLLLLNSTNNLFRSQLDKIYRSKRFTIPFSSYLSRRHGQKQVTEQTSERQWTNAWLVSQVCVECHQMGQRSWCCRQHNLHRLRRTCTACWTEQILSGTTSQRKCPKRRQDRQNRFWSTLENHGKDRGTTASSAHTEDRTSLQAFCAFQPMSCREGLQRNLHIKRAVEDHVKQSN